MSKLSQLARNRTVVLAGAAGLVVVILVGALAASGGDDEPAAQRGAEDTTTSSATVAARPGPTSSSATSATGPATTSSTGTRPTTTVVVDDRPAASWASATVPRSKVPEGWLDAWDRAKNKSTCGLLAPTEALPRLEKANASFDEINNDEGWDVRIRQEASIVEILGLFSKSAKADETKAAPFTRTWKDGSVAKYGPDVPPGMNEGDMNPESTPYEARVTIPDQDCVYQIYDTLGQSHLEFVLGHLAFAEGTR